jgi:hypothetical protein
MDRDVLLSIIVRFSMLCGVYQGYAVLWSGDLKVRLYAVKIAFLVAVATVLNYYLEGMLHGSNMGWVLVLIFSAWNIIRVENQKHLEDLKRKYDEQTHVFIKED